MVGKVQVLVAAVNQEPQELAHRMQLASDAIIVNQCDRYEVQKFQINDGEVTVFHMAERGVGLSRNTALMRATGEVCVFSDQDIVFTKGYAENIRQQFLQHPEADMIVFNVEVGADRQTFCNEKWKKVHWYNCGRYGAVSFAIRKEKLLESGITFSLLFGGGAQYSAGEDSLFISQFIKRGYQVYASPITIAREREGDSTWFQGYTEKFFFDRGVLYHFLYGKMARPFALRFLWAHRKQLCQEYALREAYSIMKRGIRHAR